MRAIVIGTVYFTHAMLNELLENKANIVAVVTSSNNVINADYADLAPLCEEYNLPLLRVDDINSESSISWMKSYEPDVIFCLGWSRLIKKQVLNMPTIGVVGYHPAALPKNRGRHPLIWALALGLKETVSTFFFMDEGADSGDIVSQERIEISDTDYASHLYSKMTAIAKKQIVDLYQSLEKGSYNAISQDHSQSNVWRKRGTADGKIDWRMGSTSIYNLVRALSKPYVGSHFVKDMLDVKVWACEKRELPESANIEPGKVLIVDEAGILVKCGVGGILLTNIEPYVDISVGDYL